MALTTSTNSANLDVYFRKELLDRLEKKVVLDRLAEKSVEIPKASGKQVKWLRYSNIGTTDPSTALLTEGVSPSASAITTQNITATVLQYGRYATISDYFEYSANDPVLQSVKDVLAEDASNVLELLCRNELDSNLPVQYANGKASLATTGANDRVVAKEFLKAKITLQKNSVGPHRKTGMFEAVVSPVVVGDLQADTDVGAWVDINKYADPSKPIKGTTGMVYGVSINVSDLMSSTATGTLGSATVYNSFVMGEGCLGTAKFGSQNVNYYITKASSSIADPLAQIHFVGYKILGYVAKYLGGSGNGTADRGINIKGGTGF